MSTVAVGAAAPLPGIVYGIDAFSLNPALARLDKHLLDQVLGALSGMDALVLKDDALCVALTCRDFRQSLVRRGVPVRTSLRSLALSEGRLNWAMEVWRDSPSWMPDWTCPSWTRDWPNGTSWHGCRQMARAGSICGLRWARAQGCKWDVWACAEAAFAGHITVLKWLRAEGCEWSVDTCLCAARGGHLEVLKWAMREGCEYYLPFVIHSCQRRYMRCLNQQVALTLAQDHKCHEYKTMLSWLTCGCVPKCSLQVPPGIKVPLCYMSTAQTHMVPKGKKLPCWTEQTIVSRHLFGEAGPVRIRIIAMNTGPWVWATEFSNHHPDMVFKEPTIVVENESYKSAEHYYQVQKFAGTPGFEIAKKAIMASEAPLDAWKRGQEYNERLRHGGQEYKLRDDWDTARFGVMEKAVAAKFGQSKSLERLLLATGTALLLLVNVGDAYWGSGLRGFGQNMLGKLLMRHRATLWVDLGLGAGRQNWGTVPR